jgi:DivIVA domain-containing protein
VGDIEERPVSDAIPAPLDRGGRSVIDRTVDRGRRACLVMACLIVVFTFPADNTTGAALVAWGAHFGLAAGFLAVAGYAGWRYSVGRGGRLALTPTAMVASGLGSSPLHPVDRHEIEDADAGDALGSLRTVEFRQTLRGYHIDDVDEYLERVAREVEHLRHDKAWRYVPPGASMPAPGDRGAIAIFATVEFRQTLRGYHIDGVDEYLERVAGEVERLGYGASEPRCPEPRSWHIPELYPHRPYAGFTDAVPTVVDGPQTPHRGRPAVSLVAFIGAVIVAVAVLTGGSADTAIVVSGPSTDVALARSELLPASSYPVGWKGQGSGSPATGASYFSGLSSRQAARLAGCLGMSTVSIDTQPAEAADQEYDDPSSLIWVNDTVDVYPTTAAADADREAAANVKALACRFRLWGPSLSGDLSPDLGPGEQDGQPKVLHRTVAAAGARAADDEWSMSYDYQGQKGTYYNDWVTVEKGRSESNLWISNLGRPVPAAVIDRLARAAANHMTVR